MIFSEQVPTKAKYLLENKSHYFLYYLLVLPHVSYNFEVWGNSNKSLLNPFFAEKRHSDKLHGWIWGPHLSTFLTF